MSIKHFSNNELLANVRNFRSNERSVLRNILEHICEIEVRKLHVEIGYPTIFEWLVKDLGYSESSAYRRMMAARALRAAPEVANGIADKIEDGRLNLVSLAKVQSAIRNEERRTGEKISAQTKSQLIEKTENKTTRETEKIIALEFPESMSLNHKGVAEALAVRLCASAVQDLERVRELKSHSNFGSSLEDIVAILAKDYLDKNDPLRREVKPRLAQNPTIKTTTVKKQSVERREDLPERRLAKENPAKRKPLAPSMANFIRRRAGDACEYRSDIGRRCGSRFQTQIDHIHPVAFGGSSEIENLRVLCRVHNLWKGDRVFQPSGATGLAKNENLRIPAPPMDKTQLLT